MRCFVPAILALLVLAPATPGHAVAPADNAVTVEMWDSDTFQNISAQLDKIIGEFEKTHPGIKLKIVHNQTLDKDLTAIAAGNGPDVIWLWDSAAPIADWAVNGVIQPLDKYITASHYDLNNLVPAAVEQCTWNGRVYGLPLVADSFWLWYNVKDFQAAGLDPMHPPTTLDEVMADAVKLTKRTGSGRLLRLGYQLPAYLNGNAGSPYNAVFGASLFNADGTKLTPDSPAALAAWTELRNEWALYDKLYGHDALVRFNGSLGAGFTAQDPFLQDRISMKIDGDWVPQEVRDFKKDWKYGTNYMVAPIPYPKGYAKYANHQPIATYPLVLTSNAKHPAQAWEFIRWLQGAGPTSQIAAFLYNLPQFKAALSSPQLTSLPGFNHLLPLLTKKITLVTDPPSPITDQYYTVISSYSNAILTGKITPAAAMKAVRLRLQPQLDKLLKKS